MKTIHKTGDRASGLCMNGSVLKSANCYRMCLVKWDFGGQEWVPDSSLTRTGGTEIKTLSEKGAIMIAADSGAAIRFRAYGSGSWTYWTKRDEPALSWNWSLYDYELAPSTATEAGIMSNEI